MSDGSVRNAWRLAGVSLLGLLLLIFVLYQQTIIYLVGIWNQLEQGNYAHGYLVVLISAWLVFENRKKLSALIPCPDFKAVVAIVPAVLLWVVAVLVDIEMLQTVALLLLMLSIIWLLLGVRISWILLFPVLYIGFALPIWFPLSPLLQDLTADIVFWLIRVLEVPALREGNMIVVPAGRLSIEEACSGLRYLLAALTLGTLYAYLNYATLRSRLLVVLVSAVAAVAANIIRVFTVVYLGYSSDMQHPLVYDHLAFGWYIFAGLTVVLLFFDAWLQRRRPPVSHQVPEAEVQSRQASCAHGKTGLVVPVLLAVLLASSGPWAVHRVKNQAPADLSQLNLELLADTQQWTVLNTVDDDWQPQYPGAKVYRMALQDSNQHTVYLFLGLYAAQEQGKELINDLNRISDNKVWRIGHQRAGRYNTGNWQVLEQVIKKSAGSQRLVWYWYHVAGYNTINQYQAKAMQALGLLTGRRQAAIVAIAADMDDEVESAREKLARFVEDMHPAIDHAIDAKR